MAKKCSRGEKIVARLRERARRTGKPRRNELLPLVATIRGRDKQPVTRRGLQTRQNIFQKKAKGLAGNGHFIMLDAATRQIIRVPWKKVINIQVAEA